MSESGYWGRPREPPRKAQSPFAIPAQPGASSFHGNCSLVCAPRSSFLPGTSTVSDPTGARMNTGWGTSHRSGSPGSAARSPWQIQEGPTGDPHRHRPDCAGHYDWPSLSIVVAALSAARAPIGSISKASSLNWSSRGPSLIGQIRLSSLGLMALSDSLELKRACTDEDRVWIATLGFGDPGYAARSALDRAVGPLSVVLKPHSKAPLVF